MSHHKVAYEDIIRASGHRVTKQRIVILDAVCDAGKHTTLGEIYARVRAVDPSVDRSTLYRTLKLFIELGLVVSAEPGNLLRDRKIASTSSSGLPGVWRGTGNRSEPAARNVRSGL